MAAGEVTPSPTISGRSSAKRGERPGSGARRSCGRRGAGRALGRDKRGAGESVRRRLGERDAREGNPRWAILTPTETVRLPQAVKHRTGRRLVKVEVRATIGAPAASSG